MKKSRRFNLSCGCGHSLIFHVGTWGYSLIYRVGTFFSCTKKSLQYIIQSPKRIYTKGGILIPDLDYITAMLNLNPNDIESSRIQKNCNAFDIYITLKLSSTMTCPVCNSHMISHGKHKKVIHNPTILDFDGNIIWSARRYKCKCCGLTKMEENPFTFAGISESYAQIRRIMIDLMNLDYTYLNIAQRHHISVTTVQRYADSWIVVPRQKLTESIGIDEYHSPALSNRNSTYLCIIVDNVERNLLEILPSRKSDYLKRYFLNIPIEERRKVKYVTIDMWETYKIVAQSVFPNCIIAVDPFHVIKNIGMAFTKVRIRIMGTYDYDSPGYYLLKKWHRLLESDYNLNNEAKYNHKFKTKLNYLDLFNMILELNPQLAKAYHLKEKYRQFNKTATSDNAREKLDQLLIEFSEAGIPEYEGIVNMMFSWKEEIIHSFYRPYDDRKLSNALTENINGKINSHITVSRGISNFQRFRNRAIYALNDKIKYNVTNFLTTLKRKGKSRGEYKKK